MNWEEFFTAVTAWIRDGSGLTCIEHADSERSFDEEVFCEYFVSQTRELGDLRAYRNTDTGALVVQGQLEVVLTVAFVSHSQAPEDFALKHSELMRVRARLPGVREHIKSTDDTPVDIGPTNYLQEIRDDHVFSRAEFQARFRVCVDYTDDTGMTMEPVEHVEVTTETEDVDGIPVSPSLDLDKKKIPA